MARLRFDGDDRGRLEAELSRIVDYFAVLSEAEVEDLQPMTHPLSTGTRLRNDEVTVVPTAYDPVRAAPDLDDRFIVVRSVL